ncbi:hypothetical protein Q0F99_18970 [Rathayibacter oskolensis]|uniref:hypothetical protein n=1 Tax=Rathayibacter oskolensis TaxID=1891671 RepID=UPI00265F4D1C|nr:hypothetical protein [Rathayibacter oskolensis]WKK71424.1 hypothetical protein Q0F99_18970 [Rathayibacter oskolensis]
MEIMTNADLEKIATTLLARTQAKEIEWRDSPESAEYVVRTPAFSYYLKSRDEDDLSPYRFQIYKRNDVGSSPKLYEYVTNSEDRAVASAFGFLYNAAKLNALGIDSLKDDVMKDLGL